MAISKENIDFLFDIMKFYDEEYNKIADNCFNETNRALNEICAKITSQEISVVPFGSYAIKNNYQIFEPLEFFCVLKSNRDILQKEIAQKQQAKKTKKHTIKTIYNEILTGNNQSEQTSIDIAKIIYQEIQKYIGEEDKVLFKNNVIFLKFHIDNEINLSVIIYVAYDFNEDGIIEFSKLGYKSSQNPAKILRNIQEKNIRTNGNYLLLCKLIKMLELELILADYSNINLSSKTLFVENVLYNVPDMFFQNNDFNEILHQVVNYINQCDITNIVLPGENTQMFGNKQYYANSYFKSFIKKLIFIYENADDMIKEAIRTSINENQQNQEHITNISNNDQNENNITKINKNYK